MLVGYHNVMVVGGELGVERSIVSFFRGGEFGGVVMMRRMSLW